MGYKVKQNLIIAHKLTLFQFGIGSQCRKISCRRPVCKQPRRSLRSLRARLSEYTCLNQYLRSWRRVSFQSWLAAHLQTNHRWHTNSPLTHRCGSYRRKQNHGWCPSRKCQPILSSFVTLLASWSCTSSGSPCLFIHSWLHCWGWCWKTLHLPYLFSSRSQTQRYMASLLLPYNHFS